MGASFSFLDPRKADGALTTSRYSSQVCRQWRSIILTSPTIWANSLDTKELHQRDDKWRLEVMRRTQDAPISFNIDQMHGGQHYARSFILDVLQNEWDRIRRLSVYTMSMEEAVLARTIDMMKRPAPTLEYLQFCGFRADFFGLTRRPPPGTIMFSNVSPRLTVIACEGFAFDFRFAQKAVSNVRKLWLSPPFTRAELYSALQHLPMLEDLQIVHKRMTRGSWTDNSLGDDTPHISLPRLKFIQLCDSTQLITNLLRYVIPAHGCQLVAATSFGLDELNITDLEIITQFYANFVGKIFDFQSVQFLSLTYLVQAGFQCWASSSLQFTLENWRNNMNLSSLINLGFTYPRRLAGPIFSTSPEPNLDQFSHTIFDALASRTDFGRVKELDLSLDENAVVGSRSELTQLLRELRSVTDLNVSVSTLQILMDIQATVDFVVLPNTTSFLLNGRPDDLTRDFLLSLLDERLERGVPVRVLRLEIPDKDRNHSEDAQWNCFQSYEGLTVTWIFRRA